MAAARRQNTRIMMGQKIFHGLHSLFIGKRFRPQGLEAPSRFNRIFEKIFTRMKKDAATDRSSPSSTAARPSLVSVLAVSKRINFP